VALISTEGNRAIDVFYLTKGGRKLNQSAEKSLSSAMISTLDAPPS
jgi:UTP:GlnB (protein PII) uridylyltransferase